MENRHFSLALHIPIPILHKLKSKSPPVQLLPPMKPIVPSFVLSIHRRSIGLSSRFKLIGHRANNRLGRQATSP